MRGDGGGWGHGRHVGAGAVVRTSHAGGPQQAAMEYLFIYRLRGASVLVEKRYGELQL